MGLTDQPTAQDWQTVGRVMRVIGALLVVVSALVSTTLYAGRLVERIETLGKEIAALTLAVNDAKVIAVEVRSLANSVQVIVANQAALAATDAELRRQIEDLRTELRVNETRRNDLKTR